MSLVFRAAQPRNAGALRTFFIVFVIGFCLLATSRASAAILTFEALAHGEVATSQFVTQFGLTISANNPNRAFDLGIIFDTARRGTADPDLEGPGWSGGNVPSSTALGKILILAENNIDTQAPFGFIDSPDDEGNRPAGDLIFQFASPIAAFGFDVVDVEGVLDENGWISFHLGTTLVGQVNFAQFVTPGPFFEPGANFGNHSLNRISPITAAELIPPTIGGVPVAGFDRVVVHLGGSGGLDNIQIIVPEPAGAASALVALGLFARRVRKD